jgi:hypothetical protein
VTSRRRSSRGSGRRSGGYDFSIPKRRLFQHYRHFSDVAPSAAHVLISPTSGHRTLSAARVSASPTTVESMARLALHIADARIRSGHDKCMCVSLLLRQPRLLDSGQVAQQAQESDTHHVSHGDGFREKRNPSYALPHNPMSADRVRWKHIQRICNRNVSETARRLNLICIGGRCSGFWRSARRGNSRSLPGLGNPSITSSSRDAARCRFESVYDALRSCDRDRSADGRRRPAIQRWQANGRA